MLRRLLLDMTVMGVSDIYLSIVIAVKSYWQTPLLNHIDTHIERRAATKL